MVYQKEAFAFATADLLRAPESCATLRLS
jgi:hypothetical protein